MMKSRLPALLFAAFLSAPLVAQYAGSTPVDPRLRPGFEHLSEDLCRPILGYLAGEECQGRGTGTDGYEKAAAFVAKHFKEAGLEPAGDGGTYFQNVPFPSLKTLAEESFISVGDLRLGMGTELRLDLDGSAFDQEVEVVFVTGAADEALADSKPLRQRLVILSVPNGERSAVRRQMNRERPAGILVVADTIAPPPRKIGGGGRGRWVTGSITRAAAEKLAKALGAPAEVLSAPASGTVARPGGSAKARIVVKAQEEKLQVPNVVGKLTGSDPTLREEFVVMGSHLDHLGVGADGKIRYGADDDGSGSTALVALAHAFAKNPAKPKRSLIFVAFCGEELGLIGSQYFVDHPPVPLDRMVCELQMDMIGRNEESRTEAANDNLQSLHLVGSKRISMALHELVLAQNEHVGFAFEYDEEDVYGRSDHYNFARKGIPIAFFFTGFHPDYHAVSDTVDKINFAKIANTARLVYLTAFGAANRDGRFPKNAPKEAEGGK